MKELIERAIQINKELGAKIEEMKITELFKNEISLFEADDKYYPWFSNGSHAGLAYAFSYHAPSYPATAVGSRLCFKSHKLAIEWAEKLIPLYEDYLLIK